MTDRLLCQFHLAQRLLITHQRPLWPISKTELMVFREKVPDFIAIEMSFLPTPMVHSRQKKKKKKVTMREEGKEKPITVTQRDDHRPTMPPYTCTALHKGRFSCTWFHAISTVPQQGKLPPVSQKRRLEVIEDMTYSRSQRSMR